MSPAGTDVLVIGQGVIGAVAAWRARRAGLSVTSLDPQAGSGASYAAAGMLAAVTEADFGERELLELNLASAARWPAFADEVGAAAGTGIGFRRCGVLSVAYDAADAQHLARVRRLQRDWGLEVHELTNAEAREREPLLGSRIAASQWTPADHQVDPRRLVEALRVVLDALGVETVRCAAERLLTGDGGEVLGAVDGAGRVHRAEHVVVANGHGAGALLAPLTDVPVPVRAVKGQVIRLDARQAAWTGGPRILRGIVQQRPIYIVWRADGEVVVGATMEELPDDRRPTVGGVFGLLRDARALVPGLDEIPIAELTARARPATPDNLPVLGRTSRAGLVVATGHHRNGILLAAATADAFDAIFADRPLDNLWQAADPRRFDVKETA